MAPSAPARDADRQVAAADDERARRSRGGDLRRGAPTGPAERATDNGTLGRTSRRRPLRRERDLTEAAPPVVTVTAAALLDLVAPVAALSAAAPALPAAAPADFDVDALWGSDGWWGAADEDDVLFSCSGEGAPGGCSGSLTLRAESVEFGDVTAGPGTVAMADSAGVLPVSSVTMWSVRREGATVVVAVRGERVLRTRLPGHVAPALTVALRRVLGREPAALV